MGVEMKSENTFMLAGKVRAVKDLELAEATINLIVTYDSVLKECDTGSFFIKADQRHAAGIFSGDTVDIRGHMELRRGWRTDASGGKKPGRSRLVLRADNIIKF